MSYYFDIIGNMEIKVASAAFDALSQPVRLAIYRLLVAEGPAGMSAGHIGERLALAPATLSFHLASLHRAGLLHRRREGRCLIYSANFGRMQALVDFLTENCCQGDPAGCRIESLPREERRR